MHKVYAVTTTYHTDDYKIRGDSWTRSNIHLFSKREYATEYIEAEKEVLLKEWREEDEEEEESEYKFFDDYNQGEFVPYRYTFDIALLSVDGEKKEKKRKRT